MEQTLQIAGLNKILKVTRNQASKQNILQYENKWELCFKPAS